MKGWPIPPSFGGVGFSFVQRRDLGKRPTQFTDSRISHHKPESYGTLNLSPCLGDSSVSSNPSVSTSSPSLVIGGSPSSTQPARRLSSNALSNKPVAVIGST